MSLQFGSCDYIAHWTGQRVRVTTHPINIDRYPGFFITDEQNLKFLQSIWIATWKNTLGTDLVNMLLSRQYNESTFFNLPINIDRYTDCCPTLSVWRICEHDNVRTVFTTARHYPSINRYQSIYGFLRMDIIWATWSISIDYIDFCPWTTAWGRPILGVG